MSTETETKTTDKKDWRKAELGGLWKRTSKAGNNYLFGRIKVGDYETEKSILIKVFKNTYKQDGSNEPDYRVYLDDEPAKPRSVATKTKPVKMPKKAGSDSVSDYQEEENQEML